MITEGKWLLLTSICSYRIKLLSSCRIWKESYRSCNGIICLLEEDIHCFLWNSLTKQYKELSRVFDNGQKAMDDKNQAEHAFGLDFISNDYKVIRFMNPTTSPLLLVLLYQFCSYIPQILILGMRFMFVIHLFHEFCVAQN